MGSSVGSGLRVGRDEITVESVSVHGNAVSGAPFYTVAFTISFEWEHERDDHRMVATVFEAAGHVAVVDRDDPTETWAGGTFEQTLREVIEEHYAAARTGQGEGQ